MTTQPVANGTYPDHPETPYPALLEDPTAPDDAVTWEPTDPRHLDPDPEKERTLHGQNRDLTTVRVQRAYQQAAQEAGSYGDTVLWSTSRGTHIHRDLLFEVIGTAAEAATEGLHEVLTLRYLLRACMPHALTARLAVPRALERFAQQQRNDGHGALLVRRIKDTRVAGCYALVREVPTADEDLEYHTVCKMTWSASASGAEADAEIHVLAHPQWLGDPAELYDLADYFLHHHTPGDLSEMLVKMVDIAGGIGLRSNGGVYFVPLDSSRTLDAIMLLIERLDGHCGRFPVPRVATNTDFLLFAVGERLQQDLRDLERDVAEREATAKRALEDPSGKCRGVAQATVDAYMARAAELHVKAQRFMDLLDFNGTGVRDSVAAVEHRLQTLAGRAESPFAGLEDLS